MPVYRLIEPLVFPAPDLAEPNGLLAVGGDLSPRRLLLAYSLGIFPWFNPGEPILWWSPDPRCILAPDQVRISRSLGKILRRGEFSITFDRSFGEVISACARLRREKGEGTWITEEMRRAYCRLHEMGYAHSVEVWREGRLEGGLYGVCLGRCFFGESMFHRAANASKVAFASLARHLEKRGFAMLDCQLPTPHLLSLGACEVPRREYLMRLREGGVAPSISPPVSPFS